MPANLDARIYKSNKKKFKNQNSPVIGKYKTVSRDIWSYDSPPKCIETKACGKILHKSIAHANPNCCSSCFKDSVSPLHLSHSFVLPH